MPSRTVARRLDRRVARFERLTVEQKKAEAGRQLFDWRQEAFHRAQYLTAARVWALAEEPRRRALARALDSTGELLADLERVCAEAVAGHAGRHLVQGSRPLADRGRFCRPR